MLNSRLVILKQDNKIPKFRGIRLKTKRLKTAIIAILPFVLACGLLQPKATPISQVPPTRTPKPTFTAIPPTQPPVIATQTEPAEIAQNQPAEQAPQEEPTATPQPVEQPTDTPTPEPVAPTDTPEPQPTDTPPPPPTNTPAPPPPPTDTPVPAGPQVGAHGISGKVIARDKTTFAVGEKAFFTYEANNHTDQPVTFTILGIKASNGQFNTSWINPDTIQPGVPFRHDDGLTFNSPGTYQVFLAICYVSCGESGAVWEEFQSGAATITVQ